MAFYAIAVRKARKRHKCYGHRSIEPGEFYLIHTEFPGGDAGYADAAGHPVQMPECRDCAERYGRGPLIAEREATDA